MHTLDVQQGLPGGQVLAEELKQGKGKIDQRLQLRPESLWSKGFLLVVTDV